MGNTWKKADILGVCHSKPTTVDKELLFAARNSSAERVTEILAKVLNHRGASIFELIVTPFYYFSFSFDTNHHQVGHRLQKNSQKLMG